MRACMPSKYALHTHLPAYTPNNNRMTQEYGLIAIPTSAFYADAHQPSDQPPSSACMTSERRPLVRFTFCKTDATLEAAAAVLRRVGQHRQERERGEGQ